VGWGGLRWWMLRVHQEKGVAPETCGGQWWFFWHNFLTGLGVISKRWRGYTWVGGSIDHGSVEHALAIAQERTTVQHPSTNPAHLAAAVKWALVGRLLAGADGCHLCDLWGARVRAAGRCACLQSVSANRALQPLSGFGRWPQPKRPAPKPLLHATPAPKPFRPACTSATQFTATTAQAQGSPFMRKLTFPEKITQTPQPNPGPHPLP